MSETASIMDIPREGRPAPVLRFFGWGMLAVLAAFLINNILNVGFGFPLLGQLISGDFGITSLVPWAIYALCLIIAGLYVSRTPNTSLRWDGAKVHGFNVYLIRALFWSVFFVGLADALVAFMRIENLFTFFITENAARNFGRSAFVAPYVHFPLIIFGFILARFTKTLGFTWLALLIVLAELLIVFSRFVFSYEQAFMGDLVRYWYAALFLFSSAYTLFDEGHVRVDVLYAGLGNTTKGRINAFGTMLLGMTTVWSILLVGMSGKQSMINSPVTTFEVSQSGTAGMYIKYQMAVFIGLFAITMLIQFVSYFFEACADAREEPGKREHAAVSH